MEIKRISAPYSFVPLNSKVYIPAWHNKVSQDIPFEDGEDGIIEVKWRNVSPLIIRDGSFGKSEPAYSAFVNLPDGTRRYFIPGSSIKGMLRNVMAIMSFGKFEKFNDRQFGYIRNNQTGAVSVIGMGKMLRYPFKYKISDLARREQAEVKEHDLCETIFGWTDKNGSMKGRVQMGNAFCEDEGNIVENEIVKVVLGEPRASYYPLYLKQDERRGKYFKYDDANARLSGWKRYKIHEDGSSIEMPTDNGNDNPTTKFCPLKAGLTFTMRISVHNLRKIEIGALLSAITFHHTEGVYHSIGGAKSLGYGKLKYSSIGLTNLKYKMNEYLAAYEEEMNKFTTDKLSAKWISCEQIKNLVAIASKHSNDVVRIMTLKEYTETKKKSKNSNSFYCPFPENTTCSLTTALSEEYRKHKQQEVARLKAEKIREKYADSYSRIETLRHDGDLKQAKSKLQELIKILQKEGIATEEEQQRLNTLEQEIEKKEKEAVAQRQAEEAQKNAELVENGLDAFLNEKYPDGVKFKVDCWKTCESKLRKWKKTKGETELTVEEQDVLAKVVCRLKNSPKKEETKNWLKGDSKIWCEVAKYLSKERADKLFNKEERYD